MSRNTLAPLCAPSAQIPIKKTGKATPKVQLRTRKVRNPGWNKKIVSRNLQIIRQLPLNTEISELNFALYSLESGWCAVLVFKSLRNQWNSGPYEDRGPPRARTGVIDRNPGIT